MAKTPIPAGAVVVRVARTGSIQYQMPGDDRMHWWKPPTFALPDDPDDLEEEPTFKPKAPANRYANRIRQYKERIAVLEAMRDNAAESDNHRGRAANDIEQYLEAIAMLGEAALIPEDESAWFVSNSGEFRVIIPPAIPGIYNRDQHRIESYNMYYSAANPIEIATLRRAASRPGSNFFEKPDGTFPIMDWESRTFEGWGSWELFAARDAKRYRHV